MPEPSIGRIVHYVLESGPSKGQSRGAQITSVFPQNAAPPLLNLVVTLDGLNDTKATEDPHTHRYVGPRDDESEEVRGPWVTWGGPGTLHRWVTSIPHAEAVGSPPAFTPGTWHWPAGMG